MFSDMMTGTVCLNICFLLGRVVYYANIEITQLMVKGGDHVFHYLVTKSI